MSTPQDRWTAFPYFALRQAGLPFELLDAIAGEDVSHEADAVVDAQRACDPARAAALAEHNRAPLPPDLKSRKRFAKVRRALSTGGNIDPILVPDGPAFASLRTAVEAAAAAAGAVAAVEERCARRYRAHREAADRAVTGAFLGIPDLRLALFMSNESSFPVLDAWLAKRNGSAASRSADRQKLDTLVMYLQRFCAKNETNSHFGPITPGKLEAASPGLSWAADRGLCREVFFTHWAAEELAETFSRQSGSLASTRPRVNPGFFPTSRGGRLVEFRFEPEWQLVVLPEVELLEADGAVLNLCDGTRTVRQIARDLAVETSVIERRLHDLKVAGLVLYTLELPVGEPRPLDSLLQAADGHHFSRWLRVLEEFRDGLRSLERTDIEVRRAALGEMKKLFEAETGSRSERGHGRLYADRALVYEDCTRELEGLSLGGRLLDALTTDVPLYLDLVLLPARRRLRLERQVAHDWFCATFGPGRSVSLLEYLEAFQRSRPLIGSQLDTVDALVTAVRREIDAVIFRGYDGCSRRHEAPREAVEALLGRFEDGDAALTNPDVMVVAKSLDAIDRGEFRLIVGDCHAGRELLSHSSFSPMMDAAFPDFGNAMIDAYARLLEPDEVLADIIRWHPEKTAVQVALECLDVEVVGLSPKDRARVLRLRDLEVREAAGAVRLFAPRLGSFIRLMAPPLAGESLATDPFVIFSFPRFFSGASAIPGLGRDYLPRIFVDRLVLQRERWRVPVESLLEPANGRGGVDADVSALVAMRAAKRDLGLPRYVFARVPSERKALFVDLDSPLLVRQLVRHAKRSAGEVEFSEMIPAPGDLWLRHEGGVVCSELRLTYFRPRLDAEVRTRG